MIQGLVDADPNKATELMVSMPHSHGRLRAIRIIIPHIANQGQEKASEWLNTITDERLLPIATIQIASNLTVKEPEAAAIWALNTEDELQRKNAIGEVAKTWVENDAASAIKWTESLQGADRNEASKKLMRQYANQDADAAGIWLDSLQGTENYDDVAQQFITASFSSNPELSLSKIASLQNTQSQTNNYRVVLKYWHRKKPKAARAWMETNNISPEIKNRVTR